LASLCQEVPAQSPLSCRQTIQESGERSSRRVRSLAAIVPGAGLWIQILRSVRATTTTTILVGGPHPRGPKKDPFSMKKGATVKTSRCIKILLLVHSSFTSAFPSLKQPCLVGGFALGNVAFRRTINSWNQGKLLVRVWNT